MECNKVQTINLNTLPFWMHTNKCKDNNCICFVGIKAISLIVFVFFIWICTFIKYIYFRYLLPILSLHQFCYVIIFLFFSSFLLVLSSEDNAKVVGTWNTPLCLLACFFVCVCLLTTRMPPEQRSVLGNQRAHIVCQLWMSYPQNILKSLYVYLRFCKGWHHSHGKKKLMQTCLCNSSWHYN